MERTFTHINQGTCSRSVTITYEDGIVKDVCFDGGCPGNTQGVAALCIGRSIAELIPILDGIQCRNRGTSCPDQLAKALQEIA